MLEPTQPQPFRRRPWLTSVRFHGSSVGSWWLTFVVHMIVSFQPWDRYLLPVLPLICVLAGRAASHALAPCDEDGARSGQGLRSRLAAAALLWGAAWHESPRG